MTAVAAVDGEAAAGPLAGNSDAIAVSGGNAADAAAGIGALAGFRVLDLASVGPGARATRVLADYGAEVVKVGPPPRRDGAVIAPPFWAYGGHRGMRRVRIDLKAAAGREAFLALAAGADAVVESFRPGVADRLGVGPAAVEAVNERVVYCSTSGFGQTGPRRSWAGHDLNYLAASGYLHCSGRRPGGAPALPGATVADAAAGGLHAAMAVMAALLRRERTGAGARLDVSVADGAFGLMALFVDEHLATGAEPGPGHYVLTGRYACYDVYACADGRYLAVGAIEAVFWRNLCRALGLERYTEAQTDDDLQDEIRAAVAARLAERDRDDWVAELGPADCCVAPVNTVSEAVDDEQYRARGLVVEAEHPVRGAFRQTGPVWAGAPAPDGPCRALDEAATHTAELLSAAGYDEDRVAELAAAGVIA